MAELAFFALTAGIGGSVGGAIQQQQINDSTCTLYSQMSSYKSSMESLLDSLNEDILQYKSEISAQQDNILNYHDQIRLQHSQFKNTYYKTLICFGILIFLVIFMLVSKKFIFKPKN